MNTSTKPVLKSFFKLPPWRRLLAGALLWYGVVLAILFFAQRNFLYRPTQLSTAQFAHTVKDRFGGRAQVLAPFDAVILEPSRPATATAILYHGNSGNGIDRAVLEQDFTNRGYRLILAEYPGYAARRGAISEKILVQDAKNLYDAVRVRFPSQSVTLVGESLGSGIATQVAATSAVPPAALVLITPFSSMVAVAQKQLPLFPAVLVLKDQYKSAQILPRYRGPVRILVSDQDEVVGAATGLTLFDVAKQRGSAVLVRLPNAGHNTWIYQVSNDQWSLLLGPRVPSAIQ